MTMRGWIRRAIFSNLVLKLLSLALAVLLFVVVHSERQATAQAVVNVDYTVPSGKVLASKPPTSVRIAVTGPLSRLQRFRVDELGPVNVDLSSASEGYFKFGDDLLAVPMGLKVVSIRPEGFNLHFEPTYRRALPVHLELEGEPAEGYRVTGRAVRPQRVTASGPRRLVSALAVLHTEPLSLAGSNQSLREKVTVLMPPGVQQVEPATVEASITISAVLTQTLVKGVKVVVEDPVGRGAQPSPATVAVRVEGPADALSGLEAASLTARVTVEPTHAGRIELKPAIVGLPAGTKVLRVLPPAVEVKLAAAPRREHAPHAH
jgi:YbbR domain-containing protein